MQQHRYFFFEINLFINFWGLKDRNGRQKLNKNILSIYDRNLNPNPCLETIKSCLNN